MKEKLQLSSVKFELFALIIGFKFNELRIIFIKKRALESTEKNLWILDILLRQKRNRTFLIKN